MKANETPEKIYVVDITFSNYVDFDGSPINTKRIDDHDIEYTCTDAFIEKACDTIKTLLSGYIIRNFHFGDSYDIDKVVEDFRKAMKK